MCLNVLSPTRREGNFCNLPPEESQNRTGQKCTAYELVRRQFFNTTRPKPAYGRQGLDWDRWARIQFSQVHFGAKLDSTDLLWCKNVTSPTGGSNRPFRCLEEGGRALPKFLAPFQNVSKKHSGYDLLLNKYSGGFREITILM